MPFCRECGNELQVGWLNCPNCPPNVGVIEKVKNTNTNLNNIDHQQFDDLKLWIKIGVITITFSLLLIAMMVRRIPFALG
jgi:uncharacterized membrane protein YvbJ